MNPTFAYLYDDFLSDRRFERDLSLVETELARRGVEGRIVRLALFRQPRDVIMDLARGTIKNLIFVGNDETIKKMGSFLPETNLTVGYLPITQPSQLGTLLGIPMGAGAVDVLAARLVETLDVGKINDRYFLHEVVAPEAQATLDIEGRYRISPAEGGSIAIRNLGGSSEQAALCANPQDGYLEAIIQARTKQSGLTSLWRRSTLTESRVYLQKGKLVSKKEMEIFVDNQSMRGSEFTLSIIPQKMKWITGRQKGWDPTNVSPVASSLAKTKNS